MWNTPAGREGSPPNPPGDTLLPTKPPLQKPVVSGMWSTKHTLGCSEGTLRPLHPFWLFPETVPARCGCTECPNSSCLFTAGWGGGQRPSPSYLAGPWPDPGAPWGSVPPLCVFGCPCLFLSSILCHFSFLLPSSLPLFVPIRTLLPHFFPKAMFPQVFGYSSVARNIIWGPS